MRTRKKAAVLMLTGWMAAVAWSRWAGPELTVQGVRPGMPRQQAEQALGTPSSGRAAEDWRNYPVVGTESAVSLKFSATDRVTIVEGPTLELAGRPLASQADLLKRLGPPEEIQGAKPASEFDLWLYRRHRLIVVNRLKQPWRFVLGCQEPSEKR